MLYSGAFFSCPRNVKKCSIIGEILIALGKGSFLLAFNSLAPRMININCQIIKYVFNPYSLALGHFLRQIFEVVVTGFLVE